MHCLFIEDFGPLCSVIDYSDQRCLALFLMGVTQHRELATRADSTTQLNSDQDH
eukprot:c5142_g1_i1 orf=182-343(+)